MWMLMMMRSPTTRISLSLLTTSVVSDCLKCVLKLLMMHVVLWKLSISSYLQLSWLIPSFFRCRTAVKCVIFVLWPYGKLMISWEIELISWRKASCDNYATTAYCCLCCLLMHFMQFCSGLEKSFFKNCIVPLGFLPWEIQVAFLRESQLQQGALYPTYGVCWVF